ncbi:MAG: alpha/beta hydrolase, partial [Flavobacterium sp.]
MKKLFALPLLFLFLLVGCDSSDDSNSNRAPLAAQDIMNVSYGSNAEQKM